LDFNTPVLVLVLLVLGLVAGGGVLVITAAAMVDGGYSKGRLAIARSQ